MRDDLIEVTPEQEAAWLIARGHITIWETSDGKRYRVLEPGEDGFALTPKDDVDE